MNKDDINLLERWLNRKPDTATILRISAKSMGSTVVLAEHVAEEMKKDARLNLAKNIFEDCYSWADEAQKETNFFIQWLAEGERPVGTKQFKVSPLNENINGMPPIDGSAESILSCLQAANLQKDEKIIRIMEAFSNLLVNQAEAIQSTAEHKHSLEAENLRLKEALLDKEDEDAAWKKEMVGFLKGLIPANLPKNPPNS
jgi:hypothetical protein